MEAAAPSPTAEPDIARGKDSGHTRLEGQRLPIHALQAMPQIVTGQNKSIGIEPCVIPEKGVFGN